MPTFKRLAFCLLLLSCALQVKADAILQLFNLSWNEVGQKLPEIAEAGYTSLWLPPPSKAGSVYSVGYDLFDPFDLGDKDQRGSVATRYGTKEELVRMVRLAHRFGIRVYFDNIMNHRGFDVPAYNSSTPTNIYPGMTMGDFHLRITTDGFYRNVSDIRDWNSTWQVQNLSLSGLIDIAHETPNANFGLTEGTTAAKPVFVRHPANPEYYDLHPTLGRLGFGNVSQSALDANPSFYKEDVGGYLLRSIRYIVDATHCDGFRLDAVKHVPGYFFGQQSGAGKDSSTAGYLGSIQLQFDLVHGFSDANRRNSNFDTETARDDAVVFGEHLGEPPSFSEYTDAGMRLLDNPLRNYLNNVLGNPSASLAGLEQRDGGGFGASIRVMHAQSHDNDFAAHRELQNAYYFLREGLPLIYSDGYNKSPSNGGTPFPRWANAPYLGEFGENKMPDLAYLHHQLARGGTRPRWGDSDTIAFERYDYREPGIAADQTVVLFAMNDNYGNPGDISFDDGVAQDDSGMPATCYPIVNTRGQGLVVGFPPGARLTQLADAPGKDRACPDLLVRLATNDRNEAEATKNDPNPINRKIYVGSQALAPGGGAIECKIPSGGYVTYAYQWPEASRVDNTLANAAGQAASSDAIVLMQNGRMVPRMTVLRTDGKDGDAGFNPIYPFKMRGSIGSSGATQGGSHASNVTYAIDIPVITNSSPLDSLVRADGSMVNALVRLDGGVDLNSQIGLGASNTFTAGLEDLRDNKPGTATDVFLGYENSRFQFRNGPEKFAARNVVRNTVHSPGAETYSYTIGVDVTTNVSLGNGFGAGYPEETCAWVYHDPAAANTFVGQAKTTLIAITNQWRFDQSGNELGSSWRDPAYNDAGWGLGAGLLGLETALAAPIRTTLNLSNTSNVRITNYYFRTHFNLPSNSPNLFLTASNLIDDGAIFYLNGVEVFRYNMPSGAVSATTFATNVVEATNWVLFTMPADSLLPGDNVLAVEVHQASVDSSDIVFGMSLTAAPRQRSFTKYSVPVDVWVKAGYQNQINQCFLYYTTDGSSPEGAYGVGQGTTMAVAAGFIADDSADGTIDWWKGTIPAQAPGTQVKYKVALFKQGADTIPDYADAKRYALTQFAITNWNPTTAQVWLHNDLATNQVATGLAEGYHILRARAFLPRTGQSSVFNTFLQTFYYDAQPPDAVLAFPQANGDVLRSTDYDFVVRTDDTATEVEYNIIDADSNNDDANTGFNNGNGLINGTPVFAKAGRVSGSTALTQQYPTLPQEFRFTYLALPASGTATLTVRIKELTTASSPNHYRTLTRTVNLAAPPQTLAVVFPSSNGQNIQLNNPTNSYEIVACFSDTLRADVNLFKIFIDGSLQPRTNANGSLNYRVQGSYCGAGKRDLRFTWSGMTPGQHYIQITYNGDGLSLQASRLVSISLYNIPDADGDGLPDFWETEFGLDPNSGGGDDGPDGDPDHDGFKNLQEYLAGTNPRDPKSLLKLTQLVTGPTVVTWQSVPGKSYTVQSTPDVTFAFEPMSTGITAVSTNTSYTNQAPVSPKQFYRVLVQP
ncbi:MAG TPA: alpha-amylase family glycosyl hydrolase [Candidatus Saccharimonadales bacterium]|nr:alpha-amylase family glycosyl hydrolase [Candidatus Saccharimonadales bacterium]